MATHKQYVVPTSGKPIRGLIQDSVVSGVFMTSKDTFLARDQYMQLVYIGVRELVEMNKLRKIRTMQPTIIKPKPLWTGKQVISTILKNIVVSGMNEAQIKRSNKKCGLNLESKSRLAAKEWGSIGKEEGEVIFRDNEHLQGTLDKNQFGASDQGLVHSFYEIYGSEKAGELLTSLARVFAVNLQTHGFTVGLDDLLLNKEANKNRRMTIEKSHQNGLIAAAKFSEAKNQFIPKGNYSNRVVFQSEKRKDADIEELTKAALPANPFSDDKVCI
jgi:DNA-directed RNA polymerase I subunit RPA1